MANQSRITPNSTSRVGPATWTTAPARFSRLAFTFTASAHADCLEIGYSFATVWVAQERFTGELTIYLPLPCPSTFLSSNLQTYSCTPELFQLHPATALKCPLEFSLLFWKIGFPMSPELTLASTSTQCTSKPKSKLSPARCQQTPQTLPYHQMMGKPNMSPLPKPLMVPHLPLQLPTQPSQTLGSEVFPKPM